MAELFILIKNKGSKKWKGVIPARKGISKALLQKRARQQIKKGLAFKIITKNQLQKGFSKFLTKKKKRR